MIDGPQPDPFHTWFNDFTGARKGSIEHQRNYPRAVRRLAQAAWEAGREDLRGVDAGSIAYEDQTDLCADCGVDWDHHNTEGCRAVLRWKLVQATADAATLRQALHTVQESYGDEWPDNVWAMASETLEATLTGRKLLDDLNHLRWDNRVQAALLGQAQANERSLSQTVRHLRTLKARLEHQVQGLEQAAIERNTSLNRLEDHASINTRQDAATLRMALESARTSLRRAITLEPDTVIEAVQKLHGDEAETALRLGGAIAGVACVIRLLEPALDDIEAILG